MKIQTKITPSQKRELLRIDAERQRFEKSYIHSVKEYNSERIYISFWDMETNEFSYSLYMGKRGKLFEEATSNY